MSGMFVQKSSLQSLLEFGSVIPTLASLSGTLPLGQSLELGCPDAEGTWQTSPPEPDEPPDGADARAVFKEVMALSLVAKM